MIEGMEEFHAELAKLMQALADFPEIAAGETAEAVDKCLMLLQSRAGDYPPPPPESTYRRTGTLGRLWVSAQRVVHRDQSGGAFIVGRVDNATPYGPYVQDPDRQAWMHRGRWPTTDDVVQMSLSDIEMILSMSGASMVQEIVDRAE